ncbi:MAG TPA: hypothetical protein VFK37_08340, partial [Bacillales bacterium]|nr:hypothetical protein [Bacillales bacterium]
MDKQAVRLELFNWYWSIKYESLAECNRRKNKIEKTAFIHTDPEISKLYQLFAARYLIRNHDLLKAEQ